MTYVDCWTVLLERRYPKLEVLNYGVSAYGTDQAYLRYKYYGKNKFTHIVFIGFSPWAYIRNVNVYKRFLDDKNFPWIKPRFVLALNGKLKLIPNPVKKLEDFNLFLEDPDKIKKFGKYDSKYNKFIYENPLYDYSATIRLFSFSIFRIYTEKLGKDRLYDNELYNTDSEAFLIQTSILDKFVNEVKESGSIPIVLIFPDFTSVKKRIKGYKVIYEPVIDFMKAKDIDYIDLSEGMALNQFYDFKKLFAPGYHYSAIGNKIVADYIYSQLKIRKYH